MNRSKQLLYSPYKGVVISLGHATSYYMCKTPTSQVAYNHNQNSVVNYMHCASTLSRWLALAQNEEKQRNMNTSKATVIEVAKSLLLNK